MKVAKIPPGVFAQSHVLWAARSISLDTNDFTVRKICSAAAPIMCKTQVPVAHEFGHAMGNTSVLGRGDEYKSTDPNYADHGSIMNWGHTARARHFQAVVDELNKMIPGVTFGVRSVR